MNGYLEYTRAYWLHATEVITLYLGPDTGLAARQPGIINALQTPPATFYGWITPTAEFMPTAGMSVTARIDGNLCGQTTIQSLNGQLVYVLQVEADDMTGGSDHCGDVGDTVTFTVGDWTMNHDPAWDNSRAWFQPLSVPVPPTEPNFELYLPAVVRP